MKDGVLGQIQFLIHQPEQIFTERSDLEQILNCLKPGGSSGWKKWAVKGGKSIMHLFGWKLIFPLSDFGIINKSGQAVFCFFHHIRVIVFNASDEKPNNVQATGFGKQSDDSHSNLP